MADAPALGWPCRVNPPCPPPLGICTTRGTNMSSISADIDPSPAALESVGKVPETGQQLHQSISAEV